MDLVGLSEPHFGHLVGQPCPEFRLIDTDGVPLSARDLAGSPALIVFYPFTFTGICEAELTELNSSLERMDGAAGTQVNLVAVSCDPVASVRAWQEQQDYRFALASDFWPHGDATRAFGVFNERTGHALRATFLVHEERVAWSVINPAGQPRTVELYSEALEQHVAAEPAKANE